MLGKQLIAPIVAASLAAAPMWDATESEMTGPIAPPKKSFGFHVHRFGPDTATLTPPTPDSSAYFGETAPPSSPESQADKDSELAVPTHEEVTARLDQIGGRLIASESGDVLGVDAVRTELVDADLPDLAAFPDLKELNLRETNVTDEGLSSLSELENLEFLGLTGTGITDAGLLHLAGLTELRFLTLGNTKITDEGLEALAECTRLEAINLKATQVSPEGIARLQNRLPLCRVITDSVTAPQTSTSLEAPEEPRPNGFSPNLPLDAPDQTSGPDAKTLEIPLPPGRSFDTEQPLTPPQTLPDVSRQQTAAPAPMNMIAREVDWPAAPSHNLTPHRRSPQTAAPVIAAMNPEQRLVRMLRERLEDPDVLQAFAQVYADQGNWNEARRMLQSAVRWDSADVSLRYELGVACARCGDFDSAFQHFEATLGEARAHYNIGVLLHEQGQTIAAKREFHEALRRDDSLAAAHEWLAFIQGWEQVPVASDEDNYALTDEQIRRMFLPPSAKLARDFKQASFGDQTPHRVDIRPQWSAPESPLRR